VGLKHEWVSRCAQLIADSCDTQQQQQPGNIPSHDAPFAYAVALLWLLLLLWMALQVLHARQAQHLGAALQPAARIRTHAGAHH
jgi:hypothetical protein